MSQNTKPGISSSTLHILAMAFMLCDHLWAMLFPAQEWLTCAGRIAYPIFAFMIVEGYFHTHDLRRYILRLLFAALLSEIPFNLMYGGSMFYPFHQNVLWTFLLGLLLIVLIEKCRHRFHPAWAMAASAGLAAMGYVLGYVAMVDYFGVGILTVLVFYLFRSRNWKNRLMQALCLYVLNVELLGGYYYSVHLWGFDIDVVQQGFALFSLVLIWLYDGRQGAHSRAFRYFCYAFYPLHMLLLFVIRNWMLG